MKFKCGHDAPEPRNMGRGKAREARLFTYFDRKCLDCRLASEDALEASLTIPRLPLAAELARKKIRASYPG